MINKIIIFVMGVALLNLVVTGSRIYTNTGYDVKGWGEETPEQKKAFKALKQYKINKNISCADRWGGTDELYTLIKDPDFLRKSYTEQMAATDCLEQINMSPSNPRKDVPAIITTVKSLFAEDPGPQLCGKVVFNPRLGRQRVSLPSGCEIPYTIDVVGGYYQTFARNSKQFVPANTGMPIHPMAKSALAIMPIPNIDIYGICLINNMPNNINMFRKRETVIVNTNVSQRNSTRSGITGTFELMFYN